MKKQQKQLAVLMIVLVLLVVGYVGIKGYNAYLEAMKEEEQKIMLVDEDVDDIVAISYIYSGATYNFEKSTGFWKSVDNPTWVIEQERVNTMVESIAQLESYGEVVDSTNLGDYGLDEPQRMMAYTTKDGESHVIYVGDYNVTADIYYVYVDEPTNVHAIYYKILHNFNCSDRELSIVQSETEE